MNINNEICRLCGKQTKLNLSHLVPAFVLRYLKRTSVTGYIRNSDQPNLTQQDGEKYRLFCNDCENKFSADENYFARRIFIPYHKNLLKQINYDYRLARFCLLQAFRKIVYNEAITSGLRIYNPILRKKLIRARNFFKEFLIAGGKTQNEYSNHIIFTNLIKSGGLRARSLPPNINMYLLRSIDTAIVHSDKNKLFIYNKLCKIMILTFITPKKPKDYEGTRIFGMGTLHPGRMDVVLPTSILDFWITRALKVQSLQENLSDSQRELITSRFLKNEERIINSECTEAYLADENLQSES